MSQYKVMPLPLFFNNLFWLVTSEVEEGDVETSLEVNVPLIIEELKEEGLEQIEPTFRRDGWYYDRLQRRCWYEWRGTAWRAERSQFEYELEMLQSRILEREEVKAIRTLISYGSCPLELRRLLWRHEQLVHLREIYREASLHRLRRERSKTA